MNRVRLARELEGRKAGEREPYVFSVMADQSRGRKSSIMMSGKMRSQSEIFSPGFRAESREPWKIEPHLLHIKNGLSIVSKVGKVA